MLPGGSLEVPDVANKHTQTEGLAFCELEGLDKALQSTLVNLPITWQN